MDLDGFLERGYSVPFLMQLMAYVLRLCLLALLLTDGQSYCTYSAFNETGDNPNIDPVYPDNNELCDGCGTVNNYMGNAVCGVFKPTNVRSISYGAPESAYPAAYLKRQCNEYIHFPKP